MSTLSSEDNHNVSYNNVNTHNLTRLFLLTTLLLTPFSIFASEQTEILEQEAYQFLLQHYNKTQPEVRAEIKINPISRKINLKHCQQPIKFQPPLGKSHRVTLKSRCIKPAWQLFIAAEVKLFAPAVVTTRSLPKGATLKQQDIWVQEVEISSSRSAYFTRPSEVLGWQTKRSIASGTLLSAKMLKQPLDIKKGNAVIIEAKRNGITIRTTGTAMEDGYSGKQIKVKNDRSGKVIKAAVVQPGLVRVP